METQLFLKVLFNEHLIVLLTDSQDLPFSLELENISQDLLMKLYKFDKLIFFFILKLVLV